MIGHMLLVNSNRKLYISSQIVSLYLTLVTLKDQCQGQIFKAYIS